MDELQSCGRGLAERSVVPAKLAAVAAAMAENLEKHQRTLDRTDNHARAERDAYNVVASSFRSAAAQLQAAANQMAASRDLPAARHDEQALTSPEIRDAFARLIDCEQDLAALLDTVVQQDRAMIGD